MIRETLGGELWSALDLVDLDVQIWMSKCRLALDGLQISWCVTLRYQPTAMFEFHGGLVSLGYQVHPIIRLRGGCIVVASSE